MKKKLVCCGFLGVVVLVVGVAFLVWKLTWPDEDFAALDAPPAPPSARASLPREAPKPRLVMEDKVVQTLGGEKVAVKGVVVLRDFVRTESPADSAEGADASEEISGEEKAMVAWDAIVEEIGSSLGRAVTRDDCTRVNRALKKVPGERRREAVQSLLNMVSDEDFGVMRDVLMDYAQAPEVVRAVFGDLLNRPDEVKLPLLREIARGTNHANHEEARRILAAYSNLEE